MDIQIIWEAAEPCPPGCGGRHSNGGDYHEWARVERYRRGRYRVIVTDSREAFPGDRGGECRRCGLRWMKDSTEHYCGLSRVEAIALAQEIASRWQDLS